MKILMVNKFLFPKGGCEIYMLELSAYLRKLGHEVCFFGMKHEGNVVGKPHHNVQEMDFHTKSLSRIFYPFHIIWSREAAKKIKKVLLEEKPDIVHLNNINFQITPSILPVIQRYGVPIVMTLHDTQLICPNHSLYSYLDKSSCEACKGNHFWNCTKKRCIHASYPKSFLGSLEAFVHHHLRSYKRIDHFIAPSYAIREKFISFGYERDRITTIVNFASLPKISSSVVKKDYVLYFGRISAEKGIEILLKAAEMLPEQRFVIAGTGPLQDALSMKRNIEYVGHLSGEALHNLLQSAKISVYPSVWFENCPLAILESLAMGTPVIGTRTGGVPYLLDEGRCGVLVEPGNAEELKAAILDLLADEEKRAGIAERGKVFAARFGIEQYATQLIGLYDAMRTSAAGEPDK